MAEKKKRSEIVLNGEPSVWDWRYIRDGMIRLSNDHQLTAKQRRIYGEIADTLRVEGGVLKADLLGPHWLSR